MPPGFSENAPELEELPATGAGAVETGMVEAEGIAAPRMPLDLAATGIETDVLMDLALKMAYMRPNFTTEWAGRHLCLPLRMVEDLLERLTDDRLLEVLGELGPMNYRFAITDQGRRRADRLMAISGYVGPVPVSVEAYSTILEWQLAHMPSVSPEDVTAAISELVLPENAVQIAGLAASSSRSLFLYGPPGNGKTSLGRFLHGALGGELWVPRCIGVENQVIRVFDPHCHRSAEGELPERLLHDHDHRWVRIKRPFVVVGGELTLESLDLMSGSVRGYYEAPLHLKANGGTFLLDDFGCQRADPRELVNRWIIPLEHQVDYFTLQTGQQVELPFRQMLIVSTNISPDEVMSPGLLRRLGYRLYLRDPTPQRYAKIFTRYAERCQTTVASEVLDWLLQRYEEHARPLRSCEPRDLIERAQDICRFQGQPLALSRETLGMAWDGYFGNRDPAG